MSKPTSLSLPFVRANFRGFDLPSLTRFTFDSRRGIFFFPSLESCPLLEFIQVCLFIRYPPGRVCPPVSSITSSFQSATVPPLGASGREESREW